MALGLAAALSACGARGGASDGTAGGVDLALRVATGVTLDAAAYSVTGPGAFARTGTIDLRNSTTLSATIGGLPAGTGYSIAVTGTLSDLTTTCSGSAAFSIIARMTTQVTIHLLCREAPRTGSATVTGSLNVCPAIDALSASPAEATVGSPIALMAAAHDLDGVPVAITYQWSATSGLVSPPGSTTPTFTCAVPGPATLTLTVSDGDCADTTTTVVTCSPAAGGPPPVVKVNEVESNGGTPGDWVELYNPNATAVDLTGWVFRDNVDGDPTHNYVIPAGTSIAPGGYYLLEEAAFGFGLGAADSARLFAPGGVTVVDSYAWTAHAPVTYGRCPNGTGDFVPTPSTKGAANACSPPPADGGAGGSPGTDAGLPTDAGAPPADAGGGVATLPWPGAAEVVTVDELNQFTGNMSGLTYEAASAGAPAVLWAVQNGPSMLYKLVWNGTSWVNSAADGWSAGKTLFYPTGAGGPDSEGITRGEPGSPAMYVATERDNTNNATSRLAVLRVDTSTPGTTLVATHEWNLTADITPAVGANLGLEAITFVPDAFLTASGFVDESVSGPYLPASYPNHGGGLFFVGVEANGAIYAYALDHSGTGAFRRIATLTSGFPAVMDLAFDREQGLMWAYCDNTCGNRSSLLAPAAGRFQVTRFLDRPAALPDAMNNEGITFAPLAECAGGQRSFFWSDDGNTAGHSLRRGSISCP